MAKARKTGFKVFGEMRDRCSGGGFTFDSSYPGYKSDSDVVLCPCCHRPLRYRRHFSRMWLMLPHHNRGTK